MRGLDAPWSRLAHEGRRGVLEQPGRWGFKPTRDGRSEKRNEGGQKNMVVR